MYAQLKEIQISRPLFALSVKNAKVGINALRVGRVGIAFLDYCRVDRTSFIVRVYVCCCFVVSNVVFVLLLFLFFVVEWEDVVRVSLSFFFFFLGKVVH